MRVLVTGGAGYIGSHTVQKLLKRGHEVTVYDNLTTGFRRSVPREANFVMGDVRDPIMLGRVLKDKKIEAVIHFAAKLIVPESILQPIDYFENNTQGVVSLVKACIAQGVKSIVFSSTAAVYGNSVGDGLVTENSPTEPINPYGSSKLMSEKILGDCELAYGIRSVILRYFNVAGAALDGSNGQCTKEATHLVKVAAETAVGKRTQMSIFGTDYPTPDRTCVRDYIHVEDLADLHVLALSYLEKGNGGTIFNCGYGHGFSVREVLETMKTVSEKEFTVEEKPRREGDPASIVADSTKVRKAFDWTPKYDDLALICRTALDWERKLAQEPQT